MTKQLRHIYEQTTRHGKTVLYFRKGHGPRVRMPDDRQSASFRTLYNDLIDEYSEALASNEKRKADVARSVKTKIKAARTRDRKRNLSSDIDGEWVKTKLVEQKYKCCLTGIPFCLDATGALRMSPFSPSLDRIDNSKGYTKDNVMVVITAINMMRLDWGDDVFNTVIDAYAKRRGSLTTSPGAGQNANNTEETITCTTDGDPGCYETTP